VALNVSGSARAFGVHAALDNLSAGGFYLRLSHPPRVGESLLVAAQISRAVVLLRGAVLRVEPQADGTYGVAAAVTHYQIFSSADAARQTAETTFAAEF
jgi:hypothetical protein